MFLDWERENTRSSSAPLSSDLFGERFLLPISSLVDERLLSTTEAGEADLFDDRLLSTAELGEGDLFEDELFLDFSPRGAESDRLRGLLDLARAESDRLRGLLDLARASEVDALGLGVLVGVAVGGRLLEEGVVANDLLGSASRASPNVDMSGDSSTLGD